MNFYFIVFMMFQKLNPPQTTDRIKSTKINRARDKMHKEIL